MPNQLGMLLLRYIKIVPGGMLVFLPKYSLINRVMQAWEYSGMLAQLKQHKHVVGLRVPCLPRHSQHIRPSFPELRAAL